MTPDSAPSGHLYSAVTKYWPRIAAGLVVALGLIGFLVEGLTADGAIEVYIFAWGTATGGLWFIFNAVETAAADDVRSRVVEWIGRADLRMVYRGLPGQYATLFDYLFTDKHLSKRCFARSSLASFLTVSALSVVAVGQGGFDILRRGPLSAQPFELVGSFGVFAAIVLGLGYIGQVMIRGERFYDEFGRISAKTVAQGCSVTLLLGCGIYVAIGLILALLVFAEAGPRATELLELALDLRLLTGAILLSGAFNFIPDYASLLETRLVIRWMQRTELVLPGLLVDAVFTTLLSLGSVWVWFAYSSWWGFDPVGVELTSVSSVLRAVVTGQGGVLGLERVYFYSAFFTSVWLWLYAASVLVSRVLVRMNDGVGFLLRVTDVEKQPFRSMGFVAVIIISGLFLLGLPLVLL